MVEKAITAMLKLLIFGHDPKQALRVQRLLFATSTYFFYLLLVSYGIGTGLIRNVDFHYVIGGAFVANLIFYLMIRFGFSLHARDPSLTIPQIALATVVNTYMVYYAGPARGACLMGYLLILIFAMFRLRPRQIHVIGAVVLMTYACIIAIETPANKQQSTFFYLNILQWLILLFIYPWFAWIASHIMSGRIELRKSNEMLANALRENEAVLKTIQEQVTHDELTGIFNRRYMIDALKREMLRAQRIDEPFCVALVDIDHFKQINDSVGHLGGDNVLIAVTREITAQLRSTDQFGRHGGEEFLVLLSSTSLNDALCAAERIRACVDAARLMEGDIAVPVTVSIGVAEYNDGATVESLLADADRALYRAKRNGRNRVEHEASASGYGMAVPISGK